jgi:hypothetical protein
MKTYRIQDVLDRVLIANKRLPLRRMPSLEDKVVYWVEPNQSVGKLFSWIGGTPQKPVLWFQFYDSNKRPYYADYEPNRFYLQNQPNNPISIEEQIIRQKEEQKPKPTVTDKIGNTVFLVGLAAAFYLLTKKR